MTETSKAGGKPAPIFPTADQIPAELLPGGWVGFRYKWNGHKYKKPPASPVTGAGIGATKEHAEHFVNFDDAVNGSLRHRLDGVGRVFLRDEGYVCVDFDNCRDANGEIHPVVLSWLRWLPSYAEVSVSGTGVHVIGRAKVSKALTATPLPEAGETTVEVYAWDRFLTFTGQRVGDKVAICDCQPGIDKLLVYLDHKAIGVEPMPRDPRPISKRTARKIHADNLTALRSARQGEGNALLNSTAFFAAKAFAAGVFEQSEDGIKAELLQIVTRDWKQPHDVQGALATIDSGWRSGSEEPLTLRAIDGIVTNPGHVAEMVKESEHVLQSIGMKYFERNNELVNTAYGRDVPEVRECQRDANSVVIIEASFHTVVRDLDQRATFVVLSEGRDGVEEKVCHVPRILPGQIHDRVRSESRDVPFPTLDMVTASPVFLASGRIIEGVFEEGVLYAPPDRRKFPPLSEHPTRESARAAMAQFDAVFERFPFVDPGQSHPWQQTASYATVLSGVLSLVARPYLKHDHIPLIAANAPTPRYGKTKIIKAICGASLGYNPTTVHFVDEEEFGKHLLPLMRAGDRAILIDNVERTLQSTKLNILLTEGILRDRVLGESRDVVLKNHSVFFATGNNLTIGGDLTTRALRIDIDEQIERPESRHFKFDPVERAIERHPQLVVAACTALRAYVLDGMKWTLSREPWGGFKRWDRLVSGCLTWLGYADPYETRDRIIVADPIREANLDFLEACFQAYKGRPFSLSEIRETDGDVRDALLKDSRWDGHHAQWVLRRLENKVVNGYQLRRLEGRSRFQVVKLNGQGKLEYGRRAS